MPDDSYRFGSSQGWITKLDYKVRKDCTTDIKLTTSAGATFEGVIAIDGERNLSIEITPIRKISQGHFDLLMKTLRDAVKKQIDLSWKFHRERIEKRKRKPDPFPFNPVPC